MSNVGEGPNIFVRLFCFIVKLSLTFSLVYTLIPLFSKDKLIDFSLVDLVRSLFTSLNIHSYFPNNYGPLVQSLVSFYVCYFVLELFFALLFGQDIASYLLRVHTKDSFGRKRLKAILRVGIGFFTSPLLIFELPFKKKQTLKEKVSGTFFYYNLNTQTKCVSCLVLAFVSLLCLASPFLLYYLSPSVSLASKNVFSTTDLNSGLVDRGRSVSSDQSTHKMSIHSKSLELSGVVDIPDSFLFLPMVKKGVVILDKRREPFFGELYLSHQLEVSKLFDFSIVKEPFLEAKYPNLNNYLLKNKSVFVDHEQFGHEAFHFICNALDYDQKFAPYAIPKYLLNHGPFVSSYLELRERFVAMAGVKPHTKLELREYPHSHFLVLHHDARLEQYVSLSYGKNFPVYEYKASHVGALDVTQIVEKILRNSSSGKEIQKLEPFTAFDAVDYLSLLETGKFNTAEDSKALLDYFYAEYDKVRGMPENSLVRFKVNESIYNYVQELKRFLRSDVDTQDLQNVITQLERLISSPV